MAKIKYIGNMDPSPVEIGGVKHGPGAVLDVSVDIAEYLLQRADYESADEPKKTKKQAQESAED